MEEFRARGRLGMPQSMTLKGGRSINYKGHIIIYIYYHNPVTSEDQGLPEYVKKKKKKKKKKKYQH